MPVRSSFAQYLPLSYRTLVFILGIFSMAVSNLGEQPLIPGLHSGADGHLSAVYRAGGVELYAPVVEQLLANYCASHVYQPDFGILDGIKASAFAHILPGWTQRLPLSEQGLARLMPTVVALVLAIIWDRAAGRQVASNAH